MTASHESPLRTHMTALGWSPEQLIARINEVRRKRGASALHAKSAYKWVQGRQPSATTMGDIVAVLHLHRGLRVTPADLGWDGPGRRSHALDDPYNVTAGELLLASQGDDMKRRKFVLLTGSAVTACALDLLLPAAQNLRSALDGDRVSTSLLANIEASVRRSRELDDTEGSRPALVWAGGLWSTLGQVVTRCSYGDAEGRQLHRLYIEMSETYGWMLFDAAEHARAQRVYLTGLRVAREARSDPALHQATANLLASAAYQESWLGHHTEAGTLIAIASGRSDLSSRVLAVIAQRDITIAGRRGDVDGVKRATARAHEQLGDVSRGDPPWWSEWLTAAAVDGATGRAWLALSRPDDAASYLAQRANIATSAYPRDRLLALCDLAYARLQVSDPVAACEPLDQALDLTAIVDSPRVAGYLDDVIRQLRDTSCDHAKARDVLRKATVEHRRASGQGPLG
ncbi:hypothetical protein [Micromonospora sp. NPDC005324]|uniref:hypothetical protein n=1 Tax=Micromonospora sp. NPDC005324 TaxID=3157033 RepID=UPI0033B84EF9